MKGLWQYLEEIGILRRTEQPNISGECERFKSDQTFQQYMDQAKYNIITELWSLNIDDVDKFCELKRFQMALDGFSDFIDGAILSEQIKNRRQV